MMMSRNKEQITVTVRRRKSRPKCLDKKIQEDYIGKGLSWNVIINIQMNKLE